MKKTLICINSCKRLNLFKALVWPVIDLVRKDTNFDFILSLDGKDLNYINFCKKYQIPIVYSEEREGIGIAKNRVLASFPDYEHYFFLDDDVEVLDVNIFTEVIKISNIANVPHLSLGREERFVGKGEKIYINDVELSFSEFGPGAFSFFTKAGINSVGGFHTEFAKYKRFGHTEHSYRFLNNKLQKAAFVNVPSLSNCCVWHEPKSVSKTKVSISKQLIAEPEVAIMKLKLRHFPIATISKVYIENIGVSINHESLQRTCKIYRLLLSVKYRLRLT
ncbi:hypothetical protein ACQKCH_13485 [Nubsella zeaxanthinifaciens]|uniref:hypothetical protein n=1 Tax=Nubsella zeaxanthinifaciens TaxID=392412 RepID=UPI003D041ACA